MILRFLFDNHVHHRAYAELRRRGVDVEHVGEIGLGDAGDDVILNRAAKSDRIVVTRNYADFARLVQLMNDEGRQFPGVLFLSDAIPDNDVGAHVRAVEAWVDSHKSQNPIQNSYGWIDPA